jgi:hypothetical protein
VGMAGPHGAALLYTALVEVDGAARGARSAACYQRCATRHRVRNSLPCSTCQGSRVLSLICISADMTPTVGAGVVREGGEGRELG